MHTPTLRINKRNLFLDPPQNPCSAEERMYSGGWNERVICMWKCPLGIPTRRMWGMVFSTRGYRVLPKMRTYGLLSGSYINIEESLNIKGGCQVRYFDQSMLERVYHVTHCPYYLRSSKLSFMKNGGFAQRLCGCCPCLCYLKFELE